MQKKIYGSNLREYLTRYYAEAQIPLQLAEADGAGWAQQVGF